MVAAVDNQFFRESYSTSPFTISIPTNASTYGVGNLPYLNKAIVFTVTITNTDSVSYNNLDITFRYPFCV